ncbi:MAG: hypothetical protein AAGK78_00155, partial [Planctomycetota bacterium]
MKPKLPTVSFLAAAALAIPLWSTATLHADSDANSSSEAVVEEEAKTYKATVATRFDEVPVKDIVEFVRNYDTRLNIIVEESVGDAQVTMHLADVTPLRVIEMLDDQVAVNRRVKLQLKGDIVEGKQVYRIQAVDFEPAPPTGGGGLGSNIGGGGGVPNFGGGGYVAQPVKQVMTRMLEVEMNHEEQQALLEVLDEVIAVMPESQRPKVKL